MSKMSSIKYIGNEATIFITKTYSYEGENKPCWVLVFRLVISKVDFIVSFI